MEKRHHARSPRADLWAQTHSVIAELSQPRTAAELASRARIELRTVYRILAELPHMGFKVQVTETPRAGRGRPERRYQVSLCDTNSTRSKPDSRAGSLQKIVAPLDKAAGRIHEALGWARSVAGLAEELDGKELPRQIEAKKRRLMEVAARLLGELEKGNASLALAAVVLRQLTKSE